MMPNCTHPADNKKTGHQLVINLIFIIQNREMVINLVVVFRLYFVVCQNHIFGISKQPIQ